MRKFAAQNECLRIGNKVVPDKTDPNVFMCVTPATKAEAVNKLRWGSGVDISVGFDIGASASEQTFNNKAKTASIIVPTYSIFRIRPKLPWLYRVRPLHFRLERDA